MQNQFDVKFTFNDNILKYVQMISEPGHDNYQAVITSRGDSPDNNSGGETSRRFNDSTTRAKKVSDPISSPRRSAAAASFGGGEKNGSGMKSPYISPSNHSPSNKFSKHQESILMYSHQVDKSQMRTHDDGHSIEELVQMNLQGNLPPPSPRRR